MCLAPFRLAKTLLGMCEQREGNPRTLCAQNPNRRDPVSRHSFFANLSTEVHCSPLHDTPTRTARGRLFHQSTALITTTVLCLDFDQPIFCEGFYCCANPARFTCCDRRLSADCIVLTRQHFHSGSSHRALYTLPKNEYSTSAAKFDGRPPCPLREPRARKANRWNSA
jgi:hypothetical protein